MNAMKVKAYTSMDGWIIFWILGIWSLFALMSLGMMRVVDQANRTTRVLEARRLGYEYLNQESLHFIHTRSLSEIMDCLHHQHCQTRRDNRLILWKMTQFEDEPCLGFKTSLGFVGTQHFQLEGHLQDPPLTITLHFVKPMLKPIQCDKPYFLTSDLMMMWLS